MISVEGYVRGAPDYLTGYSALRRSLLCLLLIAHCPLPTALAATARDELLRLVPEDVGFCLVLEGIREHGIALANSPFVNQFRTSLLGARIRNAPETQKLTELDRFLQRYLELDASQLRDDILGDALVLAYRPGPPGKPEEEQGLFLLRARDAKLLALLVERVNTLQKESGELNDLEQCEYHGRRYYRRVERMGENYYYLRGSVLAFAPREGILRQLIELDGEAPKDVEPPLARQFRLLGVSKSLAALWLNPRAFDAALYDTAFQHKAAAATGARAVVLQTLALYWKALEGIAFSVVLDKDLTLALAIRAKVEELPWPARRFLSTASRPSAVWHHLPDNALLIFACRVDVPAVVEMLGEFVADDTRKSFRAKVEGTVEAILGKDMIKDILRSLGPDWGVCVVAPPTSAKGWVPQVISALRVRPGTASIPADLTVWNALNSLATLAVFHHNRGQPGQLSLKSTLQDKMEVKHLVNDEQFPSGLQPAFALKGEYLVLASSPEAIRRFSARPSEAPTPATGEVPLLKLSLRGWCEFLRERREPLLEYAAAKNQISKEEASQRLDRRLMGLQLFNRVELNQHSSTGLVTLTLRVQMAKPLK